MTTYKLGSPSELKRRLERSLPHAHGASLGVRVTPRDRRERRCPVYEADHYEAQAYYTTLAADLLIPLENAFCDMPGVYLTTRVHRESNRVTAPNVFTNPDWPAPLGTRRRDRNELRPQVIALIRDATPGTEKA